jgi:hypothetical protein
MYQNRIQAVPQKQMACVIFGCQFMPPLTGAVVESTTFGGVTIDPLYLFGLGIKLRLGRATHPARFEHQFH